TALAPAARARALPCTRPACTNRAPLAAHDACARPEPLARRSRSCRATRNTSPAPSAWVDSCRLVWREALRAPSRAAPSAEGRIEVVKEPRAPLDAILVLWTQRSDSGDHSRHARRL